MTIYKYRHKQKTIWSFIFALPTFLLILAVLLVRFINLAVAQTYIDLHLRLPPAIQLIVWVGFPLWALYSAVRAYTGGTMNRYKKYNLFTIFMSALSLAILTLVIIVSGI